MSSKPQKRGVGVKKRRAINFRLKVLSKQDVPKFPKDEIEKLKKSQDKLYNFIARQKYQFIKKK